MDKYCTVTVQVQLFYQFCTWLHELKHIFTNIRFGCGTSRSHCSWQCKSILVNQTGPNHKQKQRTPNSLQFQLSNKTLSIKTKQRYNLGRDQHLQWESLRMQTQLSLIIQVWFTATNALESVKTMLRSSFMYKHIIWIYNFEQFCVSIPLVRISKPDKVFMPGTYSFWCTLLSNQRQASIQFFWVTFCVLL